MMALLTIAIIVALFLFPWYESWTLTVLKKVLFKEKNHD